MLLFYRMLRIVTLKCFAKRHTSIFESLWYMGSFILNVNWQAYNLQETCTCVSYWQLYPKFYTVYMHLHPAIHTPTLMHACSFNTVFMTCYVHMCITNTHNACNLSGLNCAWCVLICFTTENATLIVFTLMIEELEEVCS